MKVKPGCILLLAAAAAAQAANPVADWWFWPDYTLPRNASGPEHAPLGYHPAAPQGPARWSIPLVLDGRQPTQRWTGLLSGDGLSRAAISVELEMLRHVDQPVGIAVAMRAPDAAGTPAWQLACYDDRLYFQIDTGRVYSLEAPVGEYWKKHAHVAAVYDGEQLALYVNGALVQGMPASGDIRMEQGCQLEISGYFENEPFMEIPNLLNRLRIHDSALTAVQAADAMEALRGRVMAGRLVPRFHFNVRPYLSHATGESVGVVWETSEPSTGTIRFGGRTPLEREIVLDEAATIHRVTLGGLSPATPCFYRVTASGPDGDILDSGLLSFTTAAAPGSPVSFAIIGDTEARPHINNRLSQLLWDERPQFVLNLGDMTDGGSESNKYQWNYEYFAGMNALHGRVPVFPVPGNGDGDLYWFNRYHVLPGERGWYAFRQGDAEFFMVNSVDRDSLQPGGDQYLWLEAALRDSRAVWKIAAHHYAPYSSDENDYGDTWSGPGGGGDPRIRQLAALYERHGVDMVLYGHLHTYERTLPLCGDRVDPVNGIVYLQAGGGGGNLEDFAPTRSWFTAKTYRGHHYCTVTLAGDRLQLRMHDLQGALRDFIELRK